MRDITKRYINIALPIALIIVVIAGFTVYLQYQKINKYKKELELMDESIEQKRSEIDKSVSMLEGQQKNLLNRFSDLSIIISNQIYSDQIGKDFFKFIDDPDGRILYREQQKIIITEIYNDFFDQIGLNDSEIDELKDLLVDKEMVNLEIIVSLLKGDMTEEQIIENERKYNDMIARADNNLRDFFENDEFDMFENYNLTLKYRNWILDFKSYLAEKEMFIDLDQEDALLDLIINETEEFNFSYIPQLSEFGNASAPSEEDKARIETYITEQEQLDEIIVDKSAVFFNREETQALEQFLMFRRNMYELGFQVTEDMKTGSNNTN